jgi:DNA repair ATPase RecN
MSGVRITSLEVENVKRVRAVALEPSDTGLTVIGGRNGQGKTSVLDAVMWTLGGDRFRPTAPLRDGADKIATKIELTNGLVAERRGEGGGVLKVTDTTGKRGGQALLNEFVSVFALDLPKFINASATEKAQMLLAQYPELGAELQRLNVEHRRIYDERLTLGRIAEQKAKYAAELVYHADAPDELLTGAQMTAKMQEALAVNAKNAELRRRVGQARTDADRAQQDVSKQQARVASRPPRLRRYAQTVCGCWPASSCRFPT